MHGMPSNRRKKLSDRKRPRKRGMSRPAEYFTSRPALAPCITTQIGVHNYNVQHGVMSPTVTTQGLTSANSLTTGTLVSCNQNPFTLRFIMGNIRMCQGCRESLRPSDGSIPKEPYNLVVARAERRPFRDTCGNLVTPTSFSNAHYHMDLNCIRKADVYFQPHMLHISLEMSEQLTEMHKELIKFRLGLIM